MNKRVLAQLAKVPVRQLHLMGACALLAAGAALWFGAVRAPLANLRMLHAEQARLTTAGAGLRMLEAQAAALAAAVRQLSGELEPGGAAARQVTLIGDINKLAAEHEVKLAGIRPMPLQQAMVFLQSSFDVDAAGSYESLLAWLDALERARARFGIAAVEMQSAKAGGKVEMHVRIASYSTEAGS